MLATSWIMSSRDEGLSDVGKGAEGAVCTVSLRFEIFGRED